MATKKSFQLFIPKNFAEKNYTIYRIADFKIAKLDTASVCKMLLM